MAVQHPVAGIVRHELDIAALGDSHEHSVSRAPERPRLPTAFSSCDGKRVAVKVNRMVIHSEIDQADADSIPESNDKRCSCRPGLAVECQPVELHIHRIRNRVVRQDGILLQDDREVSVRSWFVRLLRMHNERADHAHHFLHRHMRVIEVSAFLVESELIDELAARSDRVLARAGRPIHVIRDLEAVPVHRRWFRKVVIYDDPDAITLIHLNCRSWSAAVVTPQVYNPAWEYLLFDRFGDEMKNFDGP